MPVPDETSRAPLPRTLLRDEAENAIRDAILHGQFEPGEVLDDKELQAWLGVSRTPVREALHGLQVQGLIETSAQSYTRVAAPTPEAVGDLVETIGIVLAGAIRRTTPHLTADAAAALDEPIAAALDAIALEDPVAHLEAAACFYRLLLPECPNKSLTRYIRTSLVALSYQYRANIRSWKTDWVALPQAWKRLSAALRVRDEEAAARAVEAMHRI